MIHIDQSIVVEGKYDRMRLCSLFDCPVIETGGFNLGNSAEIREMISAAAAGMGIVILTDSDPAGMQIRDRIIRMLPEDAVYYNAYIPAVEGKEPRKRKPGAAGLLGVEGVDDEMIISSVLTALAGVPQGTARTDDAQMSDLYEAGLVGRKDSSEKRAAFLRDRGLPPGMSPKQLLRYFNASVGGNGLKKLLKEL